MSVSRESLRAALAGLAFAASSAFAQATLEILPLRHATVEQVLPALRPFLEPGGTLTGQAGQIIVRASPRNIAELQRILETVDRPPRQLLVSVRFEDALDASRQELGAAGALGGGRSELELRAGAAQRQSAERVDQQVRVLEGGRAFIATGQSRPLSQRQFIRTPGGVIVQETTVVQEAASGFEVVPRLSGGQAQLEIAPQRERFADLPGAVESQRVATTVAAPIGEWVEIGGAVSASAREDRGLASAGRASASQARRIWIKVEELP